MVHTVSLAFDSAINKPRAGGKIRRAAGGMILRAGQGAIEIEAPIKLKRHENAQSAHIYIRPASLQTPA